MRNTTKQAIVTTLLRQRRPDLVKLLAHLVVARATWTKLKSGDWGVRLEGLGKPGQSVQVEKKAGGSSTVALDRLIWKGNGISLWSIRKSGGSGGGDSGWAVPKKYSSGPKKERCAECGEREGTILVPDSSGASGYCCPRCAKLSRYERSYG
jgi:hypothetical protein